jgi:hypothetical protein
MFSSDASVDKVECPRCESVETHGDDFCHSCGYAYDATSSSASFSDDTSMGESCPACLYGEIHDLSYGVRQCESCGYTARDWSTA